MGQANDDVDGNKLICMAHDQGGAEIGIDRGPTLTCNHEAPIAAYANVGHFGALQEVDVSDPLRAKGGDTGNGGESLVCVHGTQDPCVSTDTAFALGRNNGGENAIAFSCKDHGGDAGPIAPTLRSMGHDGSHANAGGQVAVAFAQNSRDEVRLMGGDGQIVGALAAEPGMKQMCYVAQPAVAVSLRGREGGATAELGDEVGNCLRASGGGGDKAHVLAPVAVRDTSPTITSNYGKQVDSSDTALGPNVVFPTMQVRRLTPRECERLQGFEDDYTLIPWRGKPADQCPDGPRYKALGNSWAVPNVRWIGARIDRAVRQLEHANDNLPAAEVAA